MLTTLAVAVALGPMLDLSNQYRKLLHEGVAVLKRPRQQILDEWGKSVGRNPTILTYDFSVKDSTPDPFAKVLPGLPDREGMVRILWIDLLFVRKRQATQLVGTPAPEPEQATPTIAVLSDLMKLNREFGPKFTFDNCTQGTNTGNPCQFDQIAKEIGIKEGGKWYGYTEDLDWIGRNGSPSNMSSICASEPASPFFTKYYVTTVFVGQLTDGTPVMAASHFYGIQVGEKQVKNTQIGGYDTKPAVTILANSKLEWSLVTDLSIGDCYASAALGHGGFNREGTFVPMQDALAKIQTYLQGGAKPSFDDGKRIAQFIKGT